MIMLTSWSPPATQMLKIALVELFPGRASTFPEPPTVERQLAESAPPAVWGSFDEVVTSKSREQVSDNFNLKVIFSKETVSTQLPGRVRQYKTALTMMS